MSKKPFTSRFYVESDSESEPEPPPKPKEPPRLTPKQRKQLERQQRFDEEQEAQKEAQQQEAAQREEANRRRREKKARAQHKQEAAAGGGGSAPKCTPEVFTALAVLGLTPAQNTMEHINRAYRALALQHHPDKGGDPEVCKRINVAHDYLTENA